jgi:hypothetical protein
MTETLRPSGSTQGALSNLRVDAANLNDIQTLRLKITNREGAAHLVGDFHFGNDHPAIKSIIQAEAEAKYAVEDSYRRAVSPGVIAWQEARTGVGALQLGRLLGEIGHPRIAVVGEWYANPDFKEDEPPSLKNQKRLLHTAEPRPRSLDQLRAYCGLGEPGRRHLKGMTQRQAMICGNPMAKTLTYRIIVQCRISGSKGYYAERVRQAKTHYQISHPEWTPGHNDAASIRRVAKYLLADLYGAAEDWPYT